MMSRSSPSILTSVPDHLPNRMLVAGLDVERGDGAVLGLAAGADGDDFAFLRLFLGAVGDDDPAGRLLLGLDAADEHPVMERSKVHAFTFLMCSACECVVSTQSPECQCGPI